MGSESLTNREFFHIATEIAIHKLLELDDETLACQLFNAKSLTPSAMLNEFAHRCAEDKIQYPQEPTPDILCTWFREKVVDRFQNGEERVWGITNRELFSKYVDMKLRSLRDAEEEILINTILYLNTILHPVTAAPVTSAWCMLIDFFDACDKGGLKRPSVITHETLHNWFNEETRCLEEDLEKS